MKQYKTLCVFGTRPEAIKMAPVVHALNSDPEIMSKVCVTGQHRDMLDQVLEHFEITPDHDLNLMRPNQDLHTLTARILTGMRAVLLKEKPDVVLVHGDTATAFATTLSAFYLQIPVAHVEAGLRTGDLYSPFPEESNRVLIDRIAQFFFAPTDRSAQALLREGHHQDSIWVTGNTVIDALLWTRDRLPSMEELHGDFGSAKPILSSDKKNRFGNRSQARKLRRRIFADLHGPEKYCAPIPQRSPRLSRTPKPERTKTCVRTTERHF